jgi:precorrin-6B methylase 2
MRNIFEHGVFAGGAALLPNKSLRLLAPQALPQAALTTLDDPVETALFAQLVALAVKTLGARSVLDLGCGCGIPTLAAARAGANRVVGIDVMPCNVELARANIQRARLAHRVSVFQGRWQDLSTLRPVLGHADLVVANPPYVPSGDGVVVDGGPTGTRAIEAVLQSLPAESNGLALLFGSLSDPLRVLSLLDARGFEIGEVLVQSVPFGCYSSRPDTLAHLKALRAQGHAWFCDVPRVDAHEESGCASHAYLTLGVIATRADGGARSAAAHTTLAALLSDYQMRGPSAVPEGASLLAFD